MKSVFMCVWNLCFFEITYTRQCRNSFCILAGRFWKITPNKVENVYVIHSMIFHKKSMKDHRQWKMSNFADAFTFLLLTVWKLFIAFPRYSDSKNKQQENKWWPTMIVVWLWYSWHEKKSHFILIDMKQ